MKTVFVVVKYQNLSLLFGSSDPNINQISDMPEIVGMIPLDVFTSESGFNRDDYYTLKGPVSYIREITLLDTTVNRFALTTNSKYYELENAIQWENENPTITEDLLLAVTPEIVTLP